MFSCCNRTADAGFPEKGVGLDSERTGSVRREPFLSPSVGLPIVWCAGSYEIFIASVVRQGIEKLVFRRCDGSLWTPVLHPNGIGGFGNFYGGP